MNLLLDTSIFLWLQTEPERLGESLRIVQDERTELLLSAASSWEISIKYQLGKLPLPEPPERYVPEHMDAIGARAVAIEHPHALAVATLPALHRDLFDRLLVAQASLLGLTIMTADPSVAQYPVSTVMIRRS